MLSSSDLVEERETRGACADGFSSVDGVNGGRMKLEGGVIFWFVSSRFCDGAIAVCRTALRRCARLSGRVLATRQLRRFRRSG
jgi:hypothetical protein